jgi:hypothetical protein
MPDLLYCAVCEEPAGNPVDRAPWAPAPGGGAVCSPLCLIRAELEHATTGPERRDALRRGLLESPEGTAPDLVWLDMAGPCDSVARASGHVVDVDADGVTLEGDDLGPAALASIRWEHVVDAGVVDKDNAEADELRRTAYDAWKAGGRASRSDLDDLSLRAAAQHAQAIGDREAERAIDGVLEVREARA